MRADFSPLFSGSNGNAAYLRFGDTRFLIDAGVSGKRIEEALLRADASPVSLDALLVTHEHNDHIAGVGVLSRRYNLPVYATEGTWDAMADKIGQIAPRNRVFVRAGQDFYIGRVNIAPFQTPHDAAEPVGYVCACEDLRIAVATDLGHIDASWMQAARGADVLLLEANHDPDMLAAGRYPYELQRRIRGAHGHLSNEEAGRAAAELAQAGTRRIILGHLSGENNFPELAWRTVADELARVGLVPGVDVALEVARRGACEAVYHLESGVAGHVPAC